MSEQKPTNEAQVEQKEPTQKEIQDHQRNRIAFTKANRPYLKAEAEYTDLLAKIEENRLREVKARMEYVHIELQRRAAQAAGDARPACSG